MRLLVALTEVFRTDGGIPQFNRALLRGLADFCQRTGAGATVLSLNDRPDGFDSRYLDSPRIRFQAFRRHKFSFALAFFRLALARPCDLILLGHVNLLPLATPLPLWGRRYLLMAHGIEAWQQLPWLARRALARTHTVLAVSDYTRQRLHRENRVPAHNWRVLPDTLDPFFTPTSEAAKQAPTLLSVCRLDVSERPKGVEQVLEMIPGLRRRFPKLHHVIVGEGDDRTRLELRARALGVAGSVTFTGRLDGEELRQQYAACSVFVLPSVKEGFGIVFLEAMAHAKPVVAVRAGGVPEVVAHGKTGLLVEPDDPAALEATLIRLLADPELQAQLGAAGHQRLEEHFTYERFAARLAEILQQEAGGLVPSSPGRTTIVINAVAAKMGGAATYIRELTRELARTPQTARFLFFVPPEQAEVAFSLPPHIEWHVLSVGHRGALRRFWWDQVTLRRILRRERADVLYSTANFAMLFCPVPQALLMTNSLYFSSLYRSKILPQQPWRLRFPLGLRSWLARLSLRQVEAVMSPSRSLLEEIRASGGVLPARVAVNPYGARIADRSATEVEVDSPARRPLRLLYVGLYAEHKNLATLLATLKQLRREDQVDVELVTTVDPHWELVRHLKAAARDRTQAQDLSLAGVIRFHSPVSPEDIAQLYWHCDAVVYPTLAESFGHPLLEAMMFGLPVIASDIPINRELGGTVPLYFQPFDSDDLAEKVIRLARDPGLRVRLGAAGVARARAYSWSRHVDRLRQVLDELAGHQREVPLSSVT
ncbi:MAG: glycosyltransferase [Terriglobia bacterium]